MNFREVAIGLATEVFRFLYADGKQTIDSGLSVLAEGLSYVSTRIADWLYQNGYNQWSNKVRLVNRYLFNTLRVSAYVLSAWRSIETVSRVDVDGIELDYIE